MQYAISLFIIVCIQLGMGAYLMTLNIDNLYNTWATDTHQGEQNREVCPSFVCLLFDC